MANAMKLQKATYTAEGGRMVTELVYADHPDHAQATASVVIHVHNERLGQPKEFATAKGEALVRAQELLAAEIAALK